MRAIVLALFVSALTGLSVQAMGSDCAAGACSVCGCCAATRKICRVSEEKGKKSKTVFSCECEDFCIPGKSQFCGYRAECGECGETKCVKVWKPGCGEVRTRKVLKKSTEDKEVTEYKWEVVEVCDACACHGHCGSCAGPACGASCEDASCAQISTKKHIDVASQPLMEEVTQEDQAAAELASPPTPVETVSLIRRLVRKSSK